MKHSIVITILLILMAPLLGQDLLNKMVSDMAKPNYMCSDPEVLDLLKSLEKRKLDETDKLKIKLIVEYYALNISVEFNSDRIFKLIKLIKEDHKDIIESTFKAVMENKKLRKTSKGHFYMEFIDDYGLDPNADVLMSNLEIYDGNRNALALLALSNEQRYAKLRLVLCEELIRPGSNENLYNFTKARIPFTNTLIEQWYEKDLDEKGKLEERKKMVLWITNNPEVIPAYNKFIEQLIIDLQNIKITEYENYIQPNPRLNGLEFPTLKRIIQDPLLSDQVQWEQCKIKLVEVLKKNGNLEKDKDQWAKICGKGWKKLHDEIRFVMINTIEDVKLKYQNEVGAKTPEEKAQVVKNIEQVARAKERIVELKAKLNDKLSASSSIAFQKESYGFAIKEFKPGSLKNKMDELHTELLELEKQFKLSSSESK